MKALHTDILTDKQAYIQSDVGTDLDLETAALFKNCSVKDPLSSPYRTIYILYLRPNITLYNGNIIPRARNIDQVYMD